MKSYWKLIKNINSSFDQKIICCFCSIAIKVQFFKNHLYNFPFRNTEESIAYVSSKYINFTEHMRNVRSRPIETGRKTE